MARSWTPNSTAIGSLEKGFWAKRPNMSPDEGGRSTRGSNAFLETFDGDRVFMWINDVTSDFAMSGETAQSAQTRTFFAHNLNQPTLVFSGQTPNTYQLNRLAAFVRHSHIQQTSGRDNASVLSLKLFKGGKSTRRDIQRGRHKLISVDGYVTNIASGATRFVNAPAFQFGFVITHVNEFLDLQDSTETARRLAQILDLLKAENPSTFMKAPIAKDAEGPFVPLGGFEDE